MPGPTQSEALKQEDPITVLNSFADAPALTDVATACPIVQDLSFSLIPVTSKYR